MAQQVSEVQYAVASSWQREYGTRGEVGARQTGSFRVGFDIFQIRGHCHGATTAWLEIQRVGWVREREDIDAFLAARAQREAAAEGKEP